MSTTWLAATRAQGRSARRQRVGVEGVDNERRGLFSRDGGTVVYVWCLRNEPVWCVVVWREGPVVDDGEGGRCRGRGAEAARDWE